MCQAEADVKKVGIPPIPIASPVASHSKWELERTPFRQKEIGVNTAKHIFKLYKEYTEQRNTQKVFAHLYASGESLSKNVSEMDKRERLYIALIQSNQLGIYLINTQHNNCINLTLNTQTHFFDRRRPHVLLTTHII